LISGLQGQLTEFRDRVRRSPEEYKVVHKPGYDMAAGFTPIEAALLASTGICFLCARRQKISR
jgi:hypothetical protein